MAISEQQLASWSGQGAQQGSAVTYNSIKAALEGHDWPGGMDHRVYLQGSYPSHTNIRGDSDVDVVVESGAVFYHNVPDHLRQQYGLTTPASYTWRQFRAEVRQALIGYYGSRRVTDGRKCIKVAGHGNRLNADVVPCTAYRRYSSPGRYSHGMTFWTLSGVQIVNFPKDHLRNGSEKNSRCHAYYKPNVRVMKNARSRAGNDLPSYFLECLVYNAPDHCFAPRHADTFVATTKHLIASVENGTIQSFQCQNEQQMICGTGPHQTDLASIERFVQAMVDLWHNGA